MKAHYLMLIICLVVLCSMGTMAAQRVVTETSNSTYRPDIQEDARFKDLRDELRQDGFRLETSHINTSTSPHRFVYLYVQGDDKRYIRGTLNASGIREISLENPETYRKVMITLIIIGLAATGIAVWALWREYRRLGSHSSTVTSTDAETLKKQPENALQRDIRTPLKKAYSAYVTGDAHAAKTAIAEACRAYAYHSLNAGPETTDAELIEGLKQHGFAHKSVQKVLSMTGRTYKSQKREMEAINRMLRILEDFK